MGELIFATSFERSDEEFGSRLMLDIRGPWINQLAINAYLVAMFLQLHTEVRRVGWVALFFT